MRQLWYAAALCLFLLTSCTQPQDNTPTPVAQATKVPLISTAALTPTATLAPLPTQVPSATPSLTPTATPTPIPPVPVSAAAGVPLELIAAAQTVIAQSPAQFTWQPDPSQADLLITVIPEGEPIAHPLAAWVLALAAPFPTIPDEMLLFEVKKGWQEGRLFLDEETHALLRAWWGEPAAAATLLPLEQLTPALWENRPAFTLLPFPDLNPQLKVLRPDGLLSPIDLHFDPATYPLTVMIGLMGEAEDAAAFTTVWSGPTSNYDPSKMTRLAMTGPAGFSRATAVRMEWHGLQYPGEEVAPLLNAVDFAHMSHENPFTPDCPPPQSTGGTTFCAHERYIELMLYMGIDINEMTGNHLNDWGERNLQYTFDLFEQHGIQTFGGGRDLESARQPLLIEHNGNQLAFVGCNPVGPWAVWAREGYAGALPCDDYSYIQALITTLNEQGYIVIATLQYLEHFMYDVWAEQRRDFDGLAQAGATIVSGSQGHHPQAFNFVNGGFIHYGLGNFMADQMWSLPTRQTMIDIYTLYDGQLLSVQIWTGLIEDYGRPRPMTLEERTQLLELVFTASGWPVR